MSLNIDERVGGIIQARERGENPTHMWFYGFNEIVNNMVLSIQKVEEYLQQILKGVQPFTKFHSAVQMSKIFSAIANGYSLKSEALDLSKFPPLSKLNQELNDKLERVSIFYAHLPIDSSYHLEFPLISEYKKCSFVFTLCDLCKIDKHGLP